MNPLDRSQFFQHLERIRPELEALARRSRQPLFDADDLQQELCRIAFEREIDWSVPHERWLIVTARNILRTVARRAACFNKYVEASSTQYVESASSPIESIAGKELSYGIQCELQLLTEVERLAVEKRFFRARPKSSGVVSTLRTQLLRAKRRLQKSRRLQSFCQDLAS